MKINVEFVAFAANVNRWAYTCEKRENMISPLKHLEITRQALDKHAFTGFGKLSYASLDHNIRAAQQRLHPTAIAACGLGIVVGLFIGWFWFGA